MKKTIAIIAVGIFAIFLFASKGTAYAAISSGSVACNTPGDCLAGAAGVQYNFSFTTNDSSTVSEIDVTFPSGYSFGGYIPDASPVYVNGSLVSNTSFSETGGHTAEVFLDTPSNLSTGTVTLSISGGGGVGLTNPSTNGVTGNFTINTNAAGEVAQTNIPGVTITGGTWALSYSAGAHGTLSGTTSQAVLNGANGTAVTAVPNAGYAFVNWTGTTTTTQNPLTSTDVLNNISETANFAIIPTSPPIMIAPGGTQSYSDGNMFTVEYTLPQTPAAGSTMLTFTPISGSPIVLTLADAQPGVQTSVTFSLTQGFTGNAQILSATASTIPDGAYNVTLSYQAIGAGAAASTSVTNVAIVPVTAPTVTTVTPLTEIGQTTVTLKGYLTFGGGTIVTTGFRYGTNPDPTNYAYFPYLDENYEGTPIIFIGPVTGLSCGTIYYYQAYALNTSAIATGSLQSFQTAACSPVIAEGGTSGGNSNVIWTPATGFVSRIQTPSVTSISVASPVITAPQTAPAVSITVTLKYGSNNAQVKLLQQYLNAHGFILASNGRGSPGHENTSFGALTKAAVMKFEQAHGLVADGIVGPKVRALINS